MNVSRKSIKKAFVNSISLVIDTFTTIGFEHDTLFGILSEAVDEVTSKFEAKKLSDSELETSSKGSKSLFTASHGITASILGSSHLHHSTFSNNSRYRSKSAKVMLGEDPRSELKKLISQSVNKFDSPRKLINDSLWLEQLDLRRAAKLNFVSCGLLHRFTTKTNLKTQLDYLAKAVLSSRANLDNSHPNEQYMLEFLNKYDRKLKFRSGFGFSFVGNGMVGNPDALAILKGKLVAVAEFKHTKVNASIYGGRLQAKGYSLLTGCPCYYVYGEEQYAIEVITADDSDKIDIAARVDVFNEFIFLIKNP